MKATVNAALGSRAAISRTTFLISIPIGIGAALVASPDPFSSPTVLAAWLLIGVLSHGALGVVLLAGNRMLRSLPSSSLPRMSLRSRVSVVLVLITASAMRGAVIAGLTSLWGLDGTASAPVRILSSAFIFSAWLMIIGAVIAATDQYRVEVGELLNRLVSKDLRSGLLDPSVSEAHASAAARRVAEKTGPLRLALQAGATTGDYHRTAALINEAVRDELRPLSHEMWSNTPPVLAHPRAAASFIARVWHTPVPFRRALPLMTIFLIINSSVWHGGLRGLALGLVAGTLATLIVIPLTVWPLTVGGETRRVLANTVMYLALFLLPSTLTLLWRGYAGPLDPVVLVMAVGMPLAFWLGAAAQTVADDRVATLAGLRAAILDPEWNSHLDELRRQSAESTVATFLHNAIQSRLTAAALQLKGAAADNDVTRAETAVQLALSAVSMASHSQQTLEQGTPEARLSEFAAAWAGIADVTVDVTVDVAVDVAVDVGQNEGAERSDTTAQQRRVAWMLATEAVEECVANAIRHGGARTVRVSCQEHGDSVKVSITDDGSWLLHLNAADKPHGDGGSERPAGLGLAWINHISQGDWSTTDSAEGRTLLLSVRI